MNDHVQYVPTEMPRPSWQHYMFPSLKCSGLNYFLLPSYSIFIPMLVDGWCLMNGEHYIDFTRRRIIFFMRHVLIQFTPPHLCLLLLTWINFNPSTNKCHTHRQVWDKITYPFTILNSATVEVWEWISNFTLRIIMDIITYPCWD